MQQACLWRRCCPLEGWRQQQSRTAQGPAGTWLVQLCKAVQRSQGILQQACCWWRSATHTWTQNQQSLCVWQKHAEITQQVVASLPLVEVPPTRGMEPAAVTHCSRACRQTSSSWAKLGLNPVKPSPPTTSSTANPGVRAQVSPSA